MVCDGLGRPLTFFLSPGQMSDAKGALALVDALPPAKMLLADKGYDADWFREALQDKGIAACIPARCGRKTPAHHDPKLYKLRHQKAGKPHKVIITAVARKLVTLANALCTKRQKWAPSTL